AVRSWEDVGRAHGTRGLDELLVDAEAYARDGYVVTGVLEKYFALNEAILAHDPDATALFFDHHGGVPRAGTLLRNPGLAEVIAQIRKGGAEAFYNGPAAPAIVAKLWTGGNPMEIEDLTSHRTQGTRPWRLPWGDGEVLAHPPNSQGATAQVVLGALAGDAPQDEAAWAHLAIEAFKHAFGIRDTRFGDPDIVSIREDDVIAPELLAGVRRSIDPDRVTARFGGPDRGDTVAIVAVDSEGRAVSLIESLFMNFGSGLVAGETGIVLQNRGAYFNLIHGHPNELQGGRRPVHTLSPAMYLRGQKPELVYGAMGGDGQPQIHVQLLHNVYEREMPLQQAIDAPRWVAGRPHIPGHDDMMTQVVVAESRLPEETVAGLERRGHRVTRVEEFDSAVGHAHMIRVDQKSGTLAGAADPRADSVALGI
ncbi:MAG: gamma-glutamyltransferase, partial [Candidatus Eremiobacteraeota bacterium]|nr:gamma-glutamyltransferase [Candidatus Eremiobacteraeota bacterium]